GLAQLPPEPAQGLAPGGADGAARPHRLRLGAVHERVEGGGGPLPGHHEGDPARGPGVRAQAGHVHPQAQGGRLPGPAAQHLRALHRGGRDGHRQDHRTQARAHQAGVPAGGAQGHGGGDEGGGEGAGDGGARGESAGEGARRGGGGGMAPRKDALSKKTAAKIEKLADGVLKTVGNGKNPVLDIPVRSLANVSFSEKKRLIEMGRQKQKRYFFNVSMAKKFMQTFLVSEACKELIDSGKTTSIRDLYYVTKHTIGDTRQNTFEEQDESDPIIEDIEVTLDALREELHLF